MSAENSLKHLLISDSQPTYRSGLIRLFQSTYQVDEINDVTEPIPPQTCSAIIGKFADSDEKLELVLEMSQTAKIPTLVLIDNDEVFQIGRMLTSGATGVAYRGCDAKELMEAVDQIVQGNRFLDQRFINYVTSVWESGDDGPPDVLTEREIAVIRLTSGGLKNHQIADKLGYSIRTIGKDIKNIYRMIDSVEDGPPHRGRGQIVKFGVRKGLVDVNH